MTEYAGPTIRWYEFYRRIRELLPYMLNAVEIIDQPRFGSRLTPDMLAILNDGSHAIVEVKNTTPNTQARLQDVAEEFTALASAYRKIYPGREAKTVLVVPGALSAEHTAYLYLHGVDTVIDAADIQDAADSRKSSDSDFFAREAAATASPDPLTVGQSLLQGLDNLVTGTGEWPRYQKLCGEILEFLFCPPLGKPRAEHASREKHNRRDFILRNYRSHEFWGYVRATYEAHYIVVDAKNSGLTIRKSDVLQIANYLSPHGPGLFAIIMSRKGSGEGTNITVREQWAFNRKMIVTLDDADVRQMITMRSSEDDPAELLAQKIEDFRLGF